MLRESRKGDGRGTRGVSLVETFEDLFHLLARLAVAVAVLADDHADGGEHGQQHGGPESHDEGEGCRDEADDAENARFMLAYTPLSRFVSAAAFASTSDGVSAVRCGAFCSSCFWFEDA